jgi:hypothetical protein
MLALRSGAMGCGFAASNDVPRSLMPSRDSGRTLRAAPASDTTPVWWPTIARNSAGAEEAVMPSAPRPRTAPTNRLGIRVVWENAFFGPEERAAIEEVLAAILADGLIEAFTRSHSAMPRRRGRLAEPGRRRIQRPAPTARRRGPDRMSERAELERCPGGHCRRRKQADALVSHARDLKRVLSAVGSACAALGGRFGRVRQAGKVLLFEAAPAPGAWRRLR